MRWPWKRPPADEAGLSEDLTLSYGDVRDDSVHGPGGAGRIGPTERSGAGAAGSGAASPHANPDFDAHGYGSNEPPIDRSTPTTQKEEPAHHRWFAIALLFITCAIIAAHVGDWFLPIPALGDDASSHTTAIGTLANRIMNGDGWWSTDYNLGFPMTLYYQPLPHTFSALVCILLGGPTKAALTYKVVSLFLVMAWPFAIAAGMRRAGASWLEAGVAGALAPFVLHSLNFGYTLYDSLKIGLFSQTFGNVALPLALGELVALMRGRGSVWRTSLAAAFVATSHMFYAIALAPAVVFLWIAIALPGLRPRLGQRGSDDTRTFVERAWRSAARLIAAGATTALLLSGWLVPLIRTQAYFGGWPFGREERIDGYGLDRLLGTALDPETEEVMRGGLFNGLMDGDHTPVLLALAAIGLVACFVRARRDVYARVALVLVAWSTFGMLGRTSLGGLVDLYPLHHNIQMFRYVSFMQFSLLLCAGVGVGAIAWICSLAKPAIGEMACDGIAAAAVVIFWVSAGVHANAQISESFSTIDSSDYLDIDLYNEMAGWLRELPPDGRMYTSRKSDILGHYHSGLLAHLGNRPAAQSYGVGLHDAIGFYPIEFFDPRNNGATPIAAMFDFRYLVAGPDTLLPDLERELLQSNGRYRLFRLGVPDEVVWIVRVGDTLESTPREARFDIRRWMNGDGPRTGTTIELDVTDPRSREALLGAPVEVNEAWNLGYDAPPEGEVEWSQADASDLIARVNLEESAYVALKIGYHPFWRVWVDEVEVEPIFVFPSYPAVRVGAGEHQIRAEFRWPSYTRTLWAIGSSWLFMVALIEWRIGPTRPRKRSRGRGGADLV